MVRFESVAAFWIDPNKTNGLEVAANSAQAAKEIYGSAYPGTEVATLVEGQKLHVGFLVDR
jgi:hypothetical protein